MSSTTIVILAAAVVVVVFFFINRASRGQQVDRGEEYRKAASLRGWQLEVDGKEYRYSGSTEGIPWTASVSREESAPLRWQTTAVTFDHGALVIWPDFGEALAAISTPDVPKFMLTMVMSAVAKVLGALTADAEILVGANEEVKGPAGYLFRASDPARMREWLDNGAARELESEASWLGNRESPHHLITAVLWRHGLQLVTPRSVDLEQIARVVRVGATLARAARQ